MKKKNEDVKSQKRFGWTRLFYNNKFIACFSVLLAIVLWFITVSSDTQDHAWALPGVPIKITLSDAAQSDGMKVFWQANPTATVYVKGLMSSASSSLPIWLPMFRLPRASLPRGHTLAAGCAEFRHQPESDHTRSTPFRRSRFLSRWTATAKRHSIFRATLLTSRDIRPTHPISSARRFSARIR